WQIGNFPAKDKETLYESLREVDWSEHMDKSSTIAIDTVGTNNNLIHTHYTSLVIKDAVVDWFKDKTGSRPDVDVRNPDIKLNARIRGDVCTLSWDTSGERLNRRGYRSEDALGMVKAPLKENLAAGLLLLSGYNGTQELFDPMCGSGTLLVEAALIAANKAPGLMGRKFSLVNHPSYEMRRWSNIKADAREGEREVDGCPIAGTDISRDAVRMTFASAQGSGTDDIIRVTRRSIRDMRKFDSGMVVTNPPYGERLGEISKLTELYSELGKMVKSNCSNMTLHLITSSRVLADKISLRPTKADEVWNGALECRLLHYDIS
ncbi:MAG: RNA methyltransferase, partial [Deltaproteobacteria bacterium]|nr:RNA methyltransferase [Deltaproteobacteria bacterium]